MSNFFDRFKPKKGKKSGFAFNLPGLPKASFQGEGQSLGGSKPGKVIHVQLDEPGSLGMKIEKRPGTHSAIVAMVVADSQADRAGLQRGDILCFQGSNGTEEILYDLFRELAASDQRPLCFEVRRVETKASNQAAASAGSDPNTSAEAFARKQAMIAAAERREKAAKAKLKPLPKSSKKDNLPTLRSTVDRQRDEAERLAQLAAPNEPTSEAAQKAAAAAKKQEAKLAAELGYNPYEISRATAGQARNATVASAHGSLSSGTDDALPVTAPPPEPTVALDDGPEANTTTSIPVSADFSHALEVCVTSNPNPAAVKSSFAILRKLIVNATTKADAKFRKVRLANAKIKAAVVEVEGALDLMMSVGFQLTEEDGESVLTFPEGFVGEAWLEKALEMMEQYERSN